MIVCCMYQSKTEMPEVYGPFGYRFSDYVRIGVPLDLLIMVVAVTLAPLVFPC
jgi:di/tricarboxylate transporter